MNTQELKSLTALLADAIADLDRFSVYNDDLLNEEVKDLYEISARIIMKTNEAAKELKEAISYFNTGTHYGDNDPTGDMTDDRIIASYRQAMKHENLDWERTPDGEEPNTIDGINMEVANA